jgi:uncharacterized protein
MEISFDPEKRRRTLERRGLDLPDAGTVFAGPVIEFEDVRFAYPERCVATYGLLDGRMVALV